MSTPTIIDTYVMVLSGPSFDPPEHGMYMGGSPEVYVEIKRLFQQDCSHHFMAADRFGDSSCVSCGVRAWSAWWVRALLYGANTHKWMVDMDRRWRDLLESGALATVQSTFGGTVIAPVIAAIDADEPARLVGRKGSVPTMKRDLVLHPDYDRSL